MMVIKRTRRFGVHLSCFALLMLLVASCEATPNAKKENSTSAFSLSILHTNDTHSHIAGLGKDNKTALDQKKSVGGLARIAGMIKHLQKNNNNLLVLDAGDLCQDSLYYSVHKWGLVTDTANAMAWQATTLGNHEFDEGCAALANFLGKTQLPVLAANLVAGPSCLLHGSRIVSHLIVPVQGVPVGIVGIANDEVHRLSHACSDMRFVDRVMALQHEVDKLQAQGVRHIIAVTHIGLAADRELAKQVKGVDIIVGAHSHSYIGPNSRLGPYPIVEQSASGQPVLIVTAGANTQYLGKLDVDFDKEGVLLAWDGEPIRLEEGPQDEALATLVEKYTKALSPSMNSVVGFNNQIFPDGLEQCYAGDCLAAMVMTDAMLEVGRRSGADLALFNGGGICQPVPRGTISQADVLNIHPFGDRLVIKQYSGEEIFQALEHGASREDAEGLELLHASGLRYFIDLSQPVGKRVQVAELLDMHGKATPLEKDRPYTVVLSEFLAAGNHRFTMLAKGRRVNAPAPLVEEVLEAYLRKQEHLAMPVGRRILFVK